MIRHTVVFTLKHPAGSKDEAMFLRDAERLGDIPSVRKFEQLQQVSPKCTYAFGFSMEFEDQAGYSAYNLDPTHVAFVRDRWDREVVAFQEIDYVSLVQRGGAL
jgi:hypothetical protein